MRTHKTTAAVGAATLFAAAAVMTVPVTANAAVATHTERSAPKVTVQGARFTVTPAWNGAATISLEYQFNHGPLTFRPVTRPVVNVSGPAKFTVLAKGFSAARTKGSRVRVCMSARTWSAAGASPWSDATCTNLYVVPLH